MFLNNAPWKWHACAFDFLTRYSLLHSFSVFCPAYVDTSDWEFPDVCRYYFGKFGQWSSLVFSMVSLIGAMVVYWVLMSNFLYNTGQFIYSKSQCSFQYHKGGITLKATHISGVWHASKHLALSGHFCLGNASGVCLCCQRTWHCSTWLMCVALPE